MKAFLLLALALAYLPTRALSAVSKYTIRPLTVSKIEKWDPDYIRLAVRVMTSVKGGNPQFNILQGADCNPKAVARTAALTAIRVRQFEGEYELEYKGTINNASAVPSLYNSDGVPSFCVHLFFNASVGYDSTNQTIINEAFVSFNYTKILNDGESSFATVGFNDLIIQNVTDYRKNHSVDVGVEAVRAFIQDNSGSTVLPSSYRMGEVFYLCAFASVPESEVSALTNVTCSNDGSSRVLVTTNVTSGTATYDGLTKDFFPPSALMYIDGKVQFGRSSGMKCLESYVTAGYFSGKDRAFNCSGTAVTKSLGRRLEAGEGRFLQSIQEGEVPFATSFTLDRVQYDTLTASASFAGAGLSIASVILAMMI
eukprot:CAMPEP_0172380168 /NCGR_PEP_ID=MMETSP1060-20121228/70303_1 /TAXON_ID=37318 /ORGANISM="Pseudo-nitzschia pungens, Strain cf. cingulata" /LENGTH=367 /DNA_ID=CAMNT_0013107917 /DNA_START=10 /DNA_END=1113 /DNA_ORIENTATION=-